MKSSILSVIELRPLPDGNLEVSTSVRAVEEFDRPPKAPSLTCLFEEPAEATLRMRLGAARLDTVSEPGFANPSAVGPDVWLGCLPRLSEAGRALKSQDVDLLVATFSCSESTWFEVEPWAGTWRGAEAERARAAFADATANARTKPFFVHAAGDREAVRAMLLALRNGSVDETSDE